MLNLVREFRFQWMGPPLGAGRPTRWACAENEYANEKKKRERENVNGKEIICYF